MDIFHAIVLGIIQGLTEFLPVSSSGHLEIAKVILGSSMESKESLFMTVLLHGATALSTLVIFWKDIKEIISGIIQFKWNNETKFSLYVILSMLPAAAVGVLLNDQIESLFAGNILLVGFMLILTGILLFLANKAKLTNKSVGFLSAIIIGLSQAIAILPGISRSGATISTGVILGIDKVKAARFSFLMVVPLIFGKIAKDLLDTSAIEITSTQTPMYIAGFISAFITGLFACKWMIQLVKKSKLLYFSIYCFTVGAIAIGWFFLM